MVLTGVSSFMWSCKRCKNHGGGSVASPAGIECLVPARCPVCSAACTEQRDVGPIRLVAFGGRIEAPPRKPIFLALSAMFVAYVAIDIADLIVDFLHALSPHSGSIAAIWRWVSTATLPTGRAASDAVIFVCALRIRARKPLAMVSGILAITLITAVFVVCGQRNLDSVQVVLNALIVFVWLSYGLVVSAGR